LKNSFCIIGEDDFVHFEVVFMGWDMVTSHTRISQSWKRTGEEGYVIR